MFFRVLYVRSLQTVHARAITGRFSALATAQSFPLVVTPFDGPAATLKQGLGTGGTHELYSPAARIVNER